MSIHFHLLIRGFGWRIRLYAWQVTLVSYHMHSSTTFVDTNELLIRQRHPGAHLCMRPQNWNRHSRSKEVMERIEEYSPQSSSTASTQPSSSTNSPVNPFWPLSPSVLRMLRIGWRTGGSHLMWTMRARTGSRSMGIQKSMVPGRLRVSWGRTYCSLWRESCWGELSGTFPSSLVFRKKKLLTVFFSCIKGRWCGQDLCGRIWGRSWDQGEPSPRSVSCETGFWS